jgi:membrane protein required for colicin V production
MDISVLIDIGVIVILLISAGVSFFRGLIREVLTIVGALGGGFASLTFGPSLIPLTSKWFGIEEGKPAGKLFDIIPMELAAQIAAYAGVFILVFIILQLASHLISSAAQAVGLGPIDRTLGIFFGLARGLLLLGVLYLPFHLILPEDSKKEWFEHSQTMVFVQGTTEWLISFVPQGKTSSEVVNDTRSKLNAIDILGDKRISKDISKDKADAKSTPEDKKSQPTGYTDKSRKGLENLIDGNTEKTGKSYNE